jgi:DNA-binding transcriptional LysR family regulator
MELRHLRYFIQVAEDLHFARAAARLGISQPPLSQQIRLLEEELEVQLFERTSRRVTLTPAGTAFLEAARATLAQAERAITVARRAGRGELGDLRIGFNPSAPFIARVATAVNDFRRRFPDVRLSLSEMIGSAQIAAIEDRSLDIGFMRSASPPALPAGLSSTLILEERLVVAMRPDHPLAVRDSLWLVDLAEHPLVIYSSQRSGGFTEEVFALMRRAGAEPVVAQSVHEVTTLLGLAAAGVGMTIIAESLRAIQSAGLVYVPLADEGTSTSMWLVHLREGGTLPCANFLGIMQGA